MKLFSMPTFDSKIVSNASDGATIFNSTLVYNLKKAGVNVYEHSFEKLLINSPRYAKEIMCGKNILFSSIGPYAYVYSYYREIFELDIPIIRDIHGALWTGYLMQEWLNKPFVRKSDIIIFPSEFCRSLYIRLFPHLKNCRAYVWHPMFLQDNFDLWSPKTVNNNICVGYIGRLSRDKNVDDFVKTAATLQSLTEKTVEVHLLGGYYDLSIEELLDIWLKNGREESNFKYWGYNLPSNTLEKFYSEIDVLLFLSTSNAEALGRVVIEASKYSVPVCMADHAAARELLPKDNLVPFNYSRNNFLCHNGVRMGDICIQKAAQILLDVITTKRKHIINADKYNFFKFARFLNQISHNEYLFDDSTKRNVFLKRIYRDFSIKIRKSPDKESAKNLIQKLFEHLKFWLGIGLNNSCELSKELLQMSCEKERTNKFLSNISDNVVNYADLSAFPFHLAQLANFHPKAFL